MTLDRYALLLSLLGLSLLLGWLQYALWFGDNGLQEQGQLRQMLSEQQAVMDEKSQRNLFLLQEILALKNDPQAIQTRARMDLGMILPGEKVVQIVSPSNATVNPGDNGN